MSNLYQEWNEISKKIKSTKSIVDTLIQAFQINSSDPFGAMRAVTEEIQKNYNLAKEFNGKFTSSLPASAAVYLNEFFESEESKFTKTDTCKNKIEVITLLIKLSLLESNLSFQLNDTQTRIRKSVEVAFAHLQRQLVASKALTIEWSTAKKETDYEKLGGAFLLGHKIWAFKADSSGERTDLILSDARIDESGILYKSVDGLVLTEWKIVKKTNDLDKKINEAKIQAKKYAGGSLASIELSSYRYLILVSRHQLDIDENFEINEDGISYRVINIAFSPLSPSKVSARAKHVAKY